MLLRKHGLSLPQIGLAHLLALPWALKFLWAPLVDRVRLGALGRRRGWILPLQLACALLARGARARCVARGDLAAHASRVLLVNLLAATQDIATDGLAVESCSPRGARPRQRRAGRRATASA